MSSKVVRLKVNGREEEVLTTSLTTLQDVLRENLGLLSSVKDGCKQGSCGSCSVLVEGELWLSCLTPISAGEGCEVQVLSQSTKHGPQSKALRPQGNLGTLGDEDSGLQR